MTTQGRTPARVLASALAGIAIVACCMGASAGLGALAGAAGWDGSGGGAASSPPSAQPPAASAPAERTRTVTDMAGREVALPESPQRIAAMDSFSGDVCVLAGAGPQLLGAPGGVLSNELLAWLYPGLPDAMQLSGNKVNMEALLEGDVDVVLVKGSLFTSGDAAAFDTFNVPYVVVEYGTVEEQMAAIRLIGEVCGGDAAVRAGAMADYYADTVRLVEERAASVPEGARVRVYHSINDPLLTDGTGSLGVDWITRCGCVDVSGGAVAPAGSGDFTATLEEVYAWDPDLVVCNTANARTFILSDGQWRGLRAVEAGAVRNLPVSASRWGQRGDPETFLAMLWLGKEAYPNLYADVDLKETVTAYYRDVIGLDIDDATWGQIIAGEGLRSQGTGSEAGSGGGGK